jgi:hypothetical protein
VTSVGLYLEFFGGCGKRASVLRYRKRREVLRLRLWITLYIFVTVTKTSERGTVGHV